MRKSDDGFKEYTIDMLYEDQRHVVAVVMDTIQEWLECDDLSKFQPLRLTVLGAGGSGKSVVINTIITLLRKMFEFDGVVKVAAPTGVAAFNVGGETFFHLTHSCPTRGEYEANQLEGNIEKRKRLIEKFKYTLALLIDEWSLINLKEIGTTSQMIAETIYGGGPFKDADFGGLPVVVLFGDDYQLPATIEGALQCLNPPKNMGKMTTKGRHTMLLCAGKVMELFGSKCMKDNQIDDKELVNCVRLQKDLTTKQAEKLLNLSLQAYECHNGPTKRDELEENAVHLFYTNDKKNQRNIRQLARASSKTNPVAFIQPRGHNNSTGKADRRHFDKETTGTTMLCVGALVALEGRNFCPLWGSHNDACGKVDEIVFK